MDQLQPYLNLAALQQYLPVLGKLLPRAVKYLGLFVLALNLPSLPFGWHSECIICPSLEGARVRMFMLSRSPRLQPALPPPLPLPPLPPLPLGVELPDPFPLPLVGVPLAILVVLCVSGVV